MQAAYSSEMPVSSYQPVLCHNTDDLNLNDHWRENL
jgi:hypothetical protein